MQFFIRAKFNHFHKQILATLGMLFGKGTKSEIFKNYNLDLSGYLDEKKVKQMIAHITSISFQSILFFPTEHIDIEYRDRVKINCFLNKLSIKTLV